ncbi:MAG TPA: RagB/SusD family nutrient uptake outer membrane protein [Puia sp.]|jgi:tetratricopeptide (TPR) repeat protein|nr:RagB/SusD family nutrient uptake outer membrane protein [Puia sp.]
MPKSIKWILPATATLLAIFIYACNNKLSLQPQGSLLSPNVTNNSGVQGLLIGAYALLSGENVPGQNLGNGSAASNYVYGSECADDSYKGSTPSDQPDCIPLMTWSLAQSGTSAYLDEKWVVLYTGIQRANDVIRTLRQSPSISPADTVEYEAEARFLRGYYHFEGKKIWNNFPYVDESVAYANNNLDVPNFNSGGFINIWPDIVADLAYATDNLPATQPNIGRVNKWAAMAFLAKAYMYQHQYDSALSLLNQVIASGTTADGTPYALEPIYESNFNPAQKNGSESVFACQASVNDGSSTATNGGNGDTGDELDFPYNHGPGCCGFNNPSWNLVQAYKTDASGLPYLDGSYNNAPLVSDAANPWPGTVDPRLDWAVGRPGEPYFDWGTIDSTWIRDVNDDGVFVPKKNAYAHSQQGTYSSTETVFWGAAEVDANNVNLCRYADVLLWAAECEAQAGSLDRAEGYVNQVRARAANPNGFVYLNATYNANTSTYSPQTKPGDNYNVGQYAAGAFTAGGQSYAISAIQMERRLELAMEGQRFFDLSRWDNGTGTMAATLNHYVSVEKNRTGFYRVNNAAMFTKGVNEYFAIPQIELDAENAKGTVYLKQNPGYQ